MAVKKILYVVPGIDGGGVGKIVLTYMRYIDKNRYICDIASLEESKENRLPLFYQDFKAVSRNIFLLNRNYIVRLKQLVHILREEHYDIIHVNLEDASSVYLLMAMLLGVKVRIAHSHITIVPCFFSLSGLKVLLRPLLKWVTTQKFSCGIEAGKRLWGEPKNFFVMTNAIELSQFSYNEVMADDFKKAANISENTIVVGTVGRLTSQKNPLFIVEIIKELSELNPNILFLWIGEGDLRVSIEAKILEFNLSDKIRLLGNRSDVGKLLNVMDVFILPSLYEGLPIVGVEAQANGLPCLFSNTITNEIGISAYVKFLDLKSAHLWAKEIMKATSFTIDRHNAKDIYESPYNIQKAVKILEMQYDMSVGRRKL